MTKNMYNVNNKYDANKNTTYFTINKASTWVFRNGQRGFYGIRLMELLVISNYYYQVAYKILSQTVPETNLSAERRKNLFSMHLWNEVHTYCNRRVKCLCP